MLSGRVMRWLFLRSRVSNRVRSPMEEGSEDRKLLRRNIFCRLVMRPISGRMRMSRFFRRSSSLRLVSFTISTGSSMMLFSLTLSCFTFT